MASISHSDEREAPHTAQHIKRNVRASQHSDNKQHDKRGKDMSFSSPSASSQCQRHDEKIVCEPKLEGFQRLRCLYTVPHSVWAWRAAWLWHKGLQGARQGMAPQGMARKPLTSSLKKKRKGRGSKSEGARVLCPRFSAAEAVRGIAWPWRKLSLRPEGLLWFGPDALGRGLGRSGEAKGRSSQLSGGESGTQRRTGVRRGRLRPGS